MSQSNEVTEKSTNKADGEQLLQRIIIVELLIVFMGVLVVFCALMIYFDPDDLKFFVIPINLLGVIAFLTCAAISPMRTRMLEHIREIDELKKEVQELKNILTQK